MLLERGQRQIWLVWAYLGSFLGLSRAPMATKMCGTVHLDTRGHTISPNFANSLRIHMVFLNTYFDLEVGTESPHELTKSLRIWFS